MAQYSGDVSHRWPRRKLLEKWRAGEVTTDEICDADLILKTSATVHGTPVQRPCPVCEGDRLAEVYWVYGEQLGRRSGSARSLADIEAFADEGCTFTVHRVEICPDCGWNHLLSTMAAMP